MSFAQTEAPMSEHDLADIIGSYADTCCNTRHSSRVNLIKAHCIVIANTYVLCGNCGKSISAATENRPRCGGCGTFLYFGVSTNYSLRNKNFAHNNWPRLLFVGAVRSPSIIDDVFSF